MDFDFEYNDGAPVGGVAYGKMVVESLEEDDMELSNEEKKRLNIDHDEGDDNDEDADDEEGDNEELNEEDDKGENEGDTVKTRS